MDFNLKLKEEISKGDYRSEEEDNYIKMLEAESKRNLLLKIGMASVYLIILVFSLFIIWLNWPLNHFLSGPLNDNWQFVNYFTSC